MAAVPQAVIEKAFDETNIAREYEKLKTTIVSNFDERVWFMTEACASVVASLMLKDLPNPIGLNLVDGPSSEKTTVLSFFYDLPMTFRSDFFTPASFVSQAAQVSETRLAKIDLLPQIKNKCLIVPELAPLFGADKDQLLANFSILTKVFDGDGLVRTGGVHGTRGYTGDYHFVWLAATTPIRPHVWKLMGNLGSRFLFLTAESGRSHKDEVARAVESIVGGVSYNEKVANCRVAVTRFFEYLRLASASDQFERSVVWDTRGENEALLKAIAELASVTALARSTVSVWRQDGTSGGDKVDFTIPIKEAPARLVNVLYGLARGHALLGGRTRLDYEDLPLIIGVAFSSMPDNRRRVLDLILARNHPEKESQPGHVTATEIRKILGFSQPTARREIDALAALGMGESIVGAGPNPFKLQLKDEFGWLLSNDFTEHRAILAQKTSQNDAIPF